MRQTFLKSSRPSHVVLKVGVVLATIVALLIGSALNVLAASPLTITVVSVEQGGTVTLRFDNLPVNDQFAVSMGPAGSNGLGSVVAHFGSGSGFVIATFEILSDLSSDSTIVVRIDDGHGVSATTSFSNVSMAPATPTTGPTLSSTSVAATAFAPSVTPIPPINLVSPTIGAIRVLHVEQGGWVQVEIDNMPLNTLFTAIVGGSGSQGFGGNKVGDLPTESASTHVSTFEIPPNLASEAALDLRVESSGYVYLITFTNANK